MTTPYLSVIIPAYNEEQRIGKTLDAVYTYLSAQPFTWELLIVLDGVTDNTLGVIEEFAASKDGVRWIDRQENMGKGYTVRQGMLAARGQIRLFTDADNSTDMSHFDKMKPLFDQGADVVIASRDHKDAPDAEQATPQPAFKRLLGNAGNLVVQAVAVPGIWDTQCGFKAFRALAAEGIFTVARINGWGFDMEALALARHFGYQVEIVGAYWVDEPNTHVKTLDYFRSLAEAFKVRWNLLTRVYERPSGANPETQPSEAQPKI
ncbi:MAG: glycosyltransferase family 2 protein [Chloroflexi bacterium]|nr:glycosyltransferase family 2 protein [Chloroflexota bacterium]